jgi:hypothetical protein
VIRGVLLRPLPYAQPERLVRLYRLFPGHPDWRGPLSALNFTEDVAGIPSLEGTAAWSASSASLSGDGPSEHLQVGYGSASLLPVLGLNPRLGRWFSPEEERPGQDHRIVLSHALWTRRFGGDPGALGRTLLLDGEPFVVVGVLPSGVELPELCDAWVPLSFQPTQLQPAARNWHFLQAVARLRPGSTLESARRELAEASRRTIAEHPEAYSSSNFAFGPVPMREDLVRAVRSTLVLLFGAVALVLLIACFNVGNLLLARATARQRELAIRSALGAGRSALIRQLLVESLVLSLTACWDPPRGADHVGAAGARPRDPAPGGDRGPGHIGPYLRAGSVRAERSRVRARAGAVGFGPRPRGHPPRLGLDAAPDASAAPGAGDGGRGSGAGPALRRLAAAPELRARARGGPGLPLGGSDHVPGGGPHPLGDGSRGGRRPVPQVRRPRAGGAPRSGRGRVRGRHQRAPPLRERLGPVVLGRRRT